MRTSDFDYDLPARLIAQTPVEPRDSSRLVVLHRDTGLRDHRRFYELPEYMRPGDVLVFNDTRVIPARSYGRREDTGGGGASAAVAAPTGGVEGSGKDGAASQAGHPGAHRGATRRRAAGGGAGSVPGRRQDRVPLLRGGHRGSGPASPPYIHTPLRDPERYQTVYSRVPGSVAAPTAGLHFTPMLLEALKARGVAQVYATLHVGLDTFRPLRGDDPQEHTIHGEYFELGEDAAALLNAARAEGRRIVGVGTTSVRLLE